MPNLDENSDSNQIISSVVGKGGPIAGSVVSMIGALLVLIGFVLPWASCGGYRLSGFDIASRSGQWGGSGGAILYLVPFFAIGMLGVTILVIPASLWNKVPRFVTLVGSALVGLLAALACCVSSVFLLRLQAARNDPGNFGLIQLQYGFLVTGVGLLAGFAGTVIGVVTSGAGLLRRIVGPKKPDDEQ